MIFSITSVFHFLYNFSLEHFVRADKHLETDLHEMRRNAVPGGPIRNYEQRRRFALSCIWIDLEKQKLLLVGGICTEECRNVKG